jgi:Ferritin-like domain
VDHPSASPRSTPPTTSPASTNAGSEPAAGSTTTTTAPPLNPSRADKVLLQLAESVELAARDLYQSVLPEPDVDTTSSVPAGSPLGDYEGLFTTLRENHEEYANSIAGLVGQSAVPRSREVYDQFADRFTTTDVTELAAAAYDLESMLVATHPEVIGMLVGLDGAEALAAAVIVEARQASALAAVAGKLDDLDIMLVNSAEPVSLAANTELLGAATATTEG